MTIIPRYTPSMISGEQLERLFVARERILARLTERVEELGSTTSPHHTLLVGPRGSGKTHLISLVAHRSRCLAEAGQVMRIAWLPEDPWTIVSYGRLLSAILERVLPEEPWSGVSEDELDARLRSSLLNNGPVLLLMENVDQVLNAIGDLGQQRLRNLFQTESNILLIGSTTTLDRTLTDEAFPFFDFFSLIRLKPFSAEEAQTMLATLAHESGDSALEERLKDRDALSRIHTIAHLAGGQPRLWALLGSVLTVDQVDDITDLLLTRFDDLTPFYQERLARLSPQQRLIVAELASTNRALPVKEIAESVGTDQRSVAKSVRDLADLGWLAPVSTPFVHLLDRRRTYYELAEPMARLAFQIKENRGEPLKLIIEFLANWFDTDDLRSAVDQKYAQAALMMIDQDETISLRRDLASLPITRRASLALLGQIVDALAAVEAEDAEPVMSLPTALRQVIEQRYRETHSVTDMQLLLFDQALKEVGDVPVKDTQAAWIARAEQLDARVQSPTTRLMHVRWLAAGWQLEEAQAALGTLPPGLEHAQGQSALASAHASMGDPMEAIALYQQSISEHIQVLGADHPDTLTTRNNLASAVRDSGAPARAASMLEKLLEDMVRVLGADHPGTLTTRGNLASAVLDAGDPGRAAGMLEGLLKDHTRLLGPDHPDTLATRGNLASAVRAAGDPARAARMLSELLKDHTRVLGADYPDTLATRANLASAVLDAGDPARAAGLFSELLEDMVRLLGPDHPHTLTTRNNLASAVRAAGDPARAARMLSELLKDHTRVLGADYPDTLATRNNLALTVRDAGDPARAARMLSELLEDMVRLLGPDHPHTLTTRGNLAQAVRAAGDPARAAGLFSELLKDMVRLLGPDHPHTLATRANLASAVRDAGDPARAADMLEGLLEDMVRVLGPDHPHTLTTRGNLAQAVRAAGDPARAVDMLEGLLEDMVRVLGPDYPHTLTTRGNLASAVLDAGDPARAAGLFSELLKDQTRVLGADHPGTLTTRANLASAVLEAGDPAQAASMLENLLEDTIEP
ncbi:tetratricopeptide repeat protein [Actinomyces sp. W5033]|uniref:tetratricopeptide repeat protein n=1 Tax=Actinomyces sp. W5033 TaxID=3446479 RepID=UPI003EDF182D